MEARPISNTPFGNCYILFVERGIHSCLHGLPRTVWRLVLQDHLVYSDFIVAVVCLGDYSC